MPPKFMLLRSGSHKAASGFGAADEWGLSRRLACATAPKLGAPSPCFRPLAFGRTGASDQ